jgi:hypothetical protein
MTMGLRHESRRGAYSLTLRAHANVRWIRDVWAYAATGGYERG